MANKSRYEMDGMMGIRHVDLSVIVDMEYDREGYLDIVSMKAWSDRRDDFVPCSDRLIRKFQEAHWDFLYDECMDYGKRTTQRRSVNAY